MRITERIHAKSIARHVREHAEQLVRDMQSIESFMDDNRATVDYPASNIAERIANEVGHAEKEIDQVLSDMMPELQRLGDVAVPVIHRGREENKEDW